MKHEKYVRENKELKFRPQILKKSENIVKHKKHHHRSKLSDLKCQRNQIIERALSGGANRNLEMILFERKEMNKTQQNIRRSKSRAYVKSIEELRNNKKLSREMEGFTGKPKINKKSKSLCRKVSDLYNWKN